MHGLHSRQQGGGYNYDSTAIRSRYDHSTTYVTTVPLTSVCELLQFHVNKLIGQRQG